MFWLLPVHKLGTTEMKQNPTNFNSASFRVKVGSVLLHCIVPGLSSPIN